MGPKLQYDFELEHNWPFDFLCWVDHFEYPTENTMDLPLEA